MGHIPTFPTPPIANRISASSLPTKTVGASHSTWFSEATICDLKKTDDERVVSETCGSVPSSNELRATGLRKALCVTDYSVCVRLWHAFILPAYVCVRMLSVTKKIGKETQHHSHVFEGSSFLRTAELIDGLE